MRRSRLIRRQPSLSLFPFLAVLICTMGVLIVLLVLVTREANLQANEEADRQLTEHSDEIGELEKRKQRESVRAELLAALKPELQERLNHARLRRSHLEDQIRQHTDELQRLEQQLAAISSLAGAPDLSALQAEYRRIQTEITTARQALAAANEQIQQAQSSYAVIPYPGPNGTTRRPIYLECTAEGIWVRPHGLLITADDIKEPIIAGNPLDSVLLANREYWSRFGRSNDEPYPMIIVRPDGAPAYALVRQAMKSWDDEFGYELIGKDTELQFPGKDPRLAAHLAEVSTQAKATNEQILAAMVMQQRAIAMREGDGLDRFGSGSQELLGGPAGQGRGQRGNSGRNGTGGGLGQSNQQNGSGGATSDHSNVVVTATPTRGGFRIEQRGDSTGQDSQGGRYGIDNEPYAPRRNPQTQSNGGANSDSRQGSSTNQNTDGARPGQPQGTQSSQGLAIGNSSADASGAQGVPASAASLANARGTGWALPSKSPDATAYRRPIHLYCSDAFLVVDGGAYSRIPRREIVLDRPTSEHVDEMIDAVWQLIDSWGFAGYNAYWKPELHIAVERDGEARFNELVELMQGSGIEIRRKSR